MWPFFQKTTSTGFEKICDNNKLVEQFNFIIYLGCRRINLVLRFVSEGVFGTKLRIGVFKRGVKTRIGVFKRGVKTRIGGFVFVLGVDAITYCFNGVDDNGLGCS